MKLYAIQGDIPIYEQIEKLPKDAKKRTTNILVEGESTGHAHRLADGEVFESGDDIYFQTYVPTHISHEEHNIIPIETPGIYKIRRQREYMSKDMERLIVD